MESLKPPKRPSFGPITSEKNKEVGLVLVLAFLLCYLRFGDRLFIVLSVTASIIAVVFPAALKPVSFAWFGLAELLGTVMSKVVLTVVFIFVITPMGLLKRLFSGERMLMERWRKGSESVFTVRDKAFSGIDLKNPF